MTVDEVIAEIQKDELLHSRSGGGVTLSGGEPLFQYSFVHKLLEACKQKGYHTALDTCGYAHWEALEALLDYVDLFLYDIKHMDPRVHQQATGKSNKLILRNLRKISQSTKIWLRVPLIPGFNDSDENLRKVAELGREINAERVSLLPFNTYGEGKWQSVGRRHRRREIASPSKEKIEEIRRFIESFGLETAVGE
jgi:pyruvate formate lyase activating enzyme